MIALGLTIVTMFVVGGVIRLIREYRRKNQ